MEILTRLEELLLISIWRLKTCAYGVAINKEVSKKSGRDYSLGSLYFSLNQLQRKGYVLKTLGESTPERGGRSKTYYSLTPEGESALQTAREFQESLWEDIPKLAFHKK